MAPMRPHNKSRNGCKTCRKRKVKCDETSPVCSNCAKREIECIWNESPREPSTSVERSPSVYIQQPQPPPPPLPLDVPPPRLDFMTLELMHHFTNHACYTIYDHTDTIEIWKSVVPDMAFSSNCAFLLHAVLAFSALHLHHLHQAHPNASKYFYAAASHYNQALKSIPAYPDSSSSADDNHILYPTHTLISLYGFATSECVYAQSDWIDMVRTAPRSSSSYRTSPLAPLMRALASTYTTISTQLQIDMAGPSLFPSSLSYLHLPTPGAPSADEVRDPVIADTYQKAIFHLRRTWIASLHPEFRSYAAFIFLIFAPDLFFTLLWEQRPRALIIAGHYCAILRRMKGQWWTKRDWSAQIERIMGAVGEQWRAWFDWVSEVEEVRTFETYQDANTALYGTWMPS